MPFIFVLCLAGFASSFAFRAVEPMLPIIADDLGVTFRQAALLASAYSLPYAVMQLVLGPIGDAIGKSRLIRFSIAVFTIGLAFSALAPGYVSLAVARAVTGGFAGGLVPVAMALIGDRVAYAERQVSISRFLVATIGGQMIGAAIAGALSGIVGWRGVFGLMAAVAAAAGAAVVFFLKDANETKTALTVRGAWAGYRAVLSNPAAPGVLGTVTCEGILVLGVFPFIVPLMVAHGAAGSVEAGIAIGAFSVGGIVYGTVASRVLGLLGQTGMMRSGGVIVGAAYAATALPLPWIVVVILFLVAGFGFFTLHNTMQTQGTELAPRARGSAMALFAAIFFLGQGIGPVLSGVVVHAFDVRALFAGAGGLVAILGFAAAVVVRPREPE